MNNSKFENINIIQPQNQRDFEEILLERRYRYQSQLYRSLLTNRSMIGLSEEMWGKALNMLMNFVNNYERDFESLHAQIAFDTEDDSIQIRIKQNAIDISLYYAESGADFENFEEAYMSYKKGDKMYITNSTSVNIAKRISQLLVNE